MNLRARTAYVFLTASGFFSLGLAALLHGHGALAEKQAQSLDVTFGMIWEGESPSPANTDEIKNFRDEFPSIKFLHFISPAYLSRKAKPAPEPLKSLVATDYKALTGSIIAGDSAAIYLNGWKSLADNAGVRFKKGPTFWGNELAAAHCRSDCGREVMMTAYAFNDLRKLIRQSRKLFQTHGFGVPEAMLVAGHMANPEVIQAASAEGITHDFSAVAAETFSKRLHRFPLRREIETLWGGVGPEMQPFTLETNQGKITQMTANGIHLTLMSADEIAQKLDKVFNEFKANQAKSTRHLFIGVAAESFEISNSKLRAAVQQLFKNSSEAKINLRWTAESIGAKIQAQTTSATSH